MSNATRLEDLPCEILEQIALYLNVKDTIACCATCSSMRHGFSSDLIWKRKCNLKFTDYLNKSESLVEPSFEWSEIIDDELSTLSPLSTWRKNYMKQTRLFQNWREGRYNKEQFEFGSSGIYESTKIRFYQNDFIFLHTNKMSERRQQNEIWNVKETNVPHSTFNLHFPEFFRSGRDPYGVLFIDKYKIVGNKLVVSAGNVILIYDICLPSFSSIPLTCAFLFDFSEEESNHLISRARAETEFSLTPFLKNCVVCKKCSNFLVGVVSYGENIHIWDIQSGKKVREQISPLRNIIGMDLYSPDEETQHFITKLTLSGDRLRYHYYGYDLTKMEFSSFNLKYDNYCDTIILRGKFVIMVSSQQLFSYSYETSNQLAVRKCNYHIRTRSVTVVGDNLLCGTVDGTVFVMNLFNLNIINSVKLGFILISLKSICNRFVIINSKNNEVWEIGKTAKQLFKFPCDASFAAINENCTKVALVKENKIIILTFW